MASLDCKPPDPNANLRKGKVLNYGFCISLLHDIKRIRRAFKREKEVSNLKNTPDFEDFEGFTDYEF